MADNNGETKEIVISGGGNPTVGVQVSPDGAINIVTKPGNPSGLPKWDWVEVKRWYMACKERPSAKTIAKQFGIPESTVIDKIYRGKIKWKEEWEAKLTGREVLGNRTTEVVANEVGGRVQSASKALLDGTIMMTKRCQLMMASMKATGPGGMYTAEETKRYAPQLQAVGIAMEKGSATLKNMGISLAKVPKLFGVDTGKDEEEGTGSQEPLKVAYNSLKKEKASAELEAEEAVEVEETDNEEKE